jgi:hypothetical protein
MWPVIALILVSAAAAAVTVRAARGEPPSRDVPWDLGDNARKMVTISSSLAGFTITGVVLLLSFAREPGGVETPLSVAVGMFLVAFMGLIAGALMYANQAPEDVVYFGVSLQTLQYSITTMMFFRSIFFGLLANGLAPVPVFPTSGRDNERSRGNRRTQASRKQRRKEANPNQSEQLLAPHPQRFRQPRQVRRLARLRRNPVRCRPGCPRRLGSTSSLRVSSR